MKKVIVLSIIFSLLMFNIGYISQLSATNFMITGTISSVAKVKEIAIAADGAYWEDIVPPALKGTEVALPVIDEATHNVIGHIIAERAKLVSALNAAGYTEVASAIAAAEVGAIAGLSVGAGISMGTIGAVAGGAAVIAGIALAVSGGGGGGVTTAHH